MNTFKQSIFIFAVITLWALACHASWGYDPMAPPGMDKSAASAPKASKSKPEVKRQAAFYLRQIVMKEGQRSAVINGYIVNEGSYINNALVQKIETGKVTLKHKGALKILTLQTRLPKIRR